MAYVKWGFLLIIIGVIAAFFHYSLPQRDILRITDSDVARMNTGTTPDGTPITRDVRFIFGIYADGGEMEFRNEDTGWGFPWYFKFDSARLANQAADLKSTADAPRWVVIRHYGWRITWWGEGVFPNALSIRPAEGPDESLTPWFNIIFLSLLVIAILVIRRILIILRKKHVDPVVDKIDAEIEETTSFWRRVFRGKK
ncbi:MAG: DUF1523 family protein [Pseudomonadota bacterium]